MLRLATHKMHYRVLITFVERITLTTAATVEPVGEAYLRGYCAMAPILPFIEKE